tara:strand:- start:2276 stop:3163 length:888 start_codon:yes stop_codon:yes gene_type:complete
MKETSLANRSLSLTLAKFGQNLLISNFLKSFLTYLILGFYFTLSCSKHGAAQTLGPLQIPFLVNKPIIDGNLDEWKENAHSDGRWDLDRVKKASWYSSKRNKLIVDIGEDTSIVDLASSYYLAWDHDYLYFGAEVIDNSNDVSESNHDSKRWYYKDAVAWFIEAPHDTIPEKFMDGNHAFAFIADTAMPDYGAWWRHGTATRPYMEQAIPSDAVEFEVLMKKGTSNYTIEVRIDCAKTLGSNPEFQGLKKGDSYSMMIVHCDPDGGEYGGHLLIYGAGDLDSSWSEIVLVDPRNE